MRGITIAIGVLCIVIAMSFVASVGYTEVVNNDVGPNIDHEDTASDLEDDTDVSNVGGDNSFFGVQITQSEKLQQLLDIMGIIPDILAWLFIPDSLANGLRSLAVITGSLATLQFIRGFLAES